MENRFELSLRIRRGRRTVFIEENARTRDGRRLKNDRLTFVSVESELLTRINTNNLKETKQGGSTKSWNPSQKSRTIKLGQL